MRPFAGLIVILLSIIWAHSLFALDPIVEFGLSHNRAIQASEKAYQGALRNIHAVSALPDPSFSVQGGNTFSSFTVAQSFPFPNKLQSETALANAEAEILKAELDGLRIQVATQIKIAYWNLWFNEQMIGLFQTKKESMSLLAKTAAARYQAQRGSQAEVLKFQMEANEAENERLHWIAQREIARTQLNGILGKPMPLSLTPKKQAINTLPFTLEELQKLALGRPEIQKQTAALRRQIANQNRLQSNYLPNLNLQYDRYFSGDYVNANTWTASLSIPFLWSWKWDAETRSEALIHDSILQQLASLQFQIEQEVAAKLSLLKDHEREVLFYESTAIPQSNQLFRLAIVGYQNGQLGFIETANLLSDFLKAQENSLTDQLEYWQTLAQLEATTGNLDLLSQKGDLN